MEALQLLLIACAAACGVHAKRILAVIPFNGKSHFFVYDTVLVELVRRGHEVTMVSQFPKQTPLERYTDIDVRNIGTPEVLLDLAEFEQTGLSLEMLKAEVTDWITSYEKVYHDTRIQNLLNSTVKFDLVVTEVFASDMFVGFARRLDAPLVSMISSVILPWATDRFAIPDNPAYIHTYVDYGAGPMSFFSRVKNTVWYVLLRYIYNNYITTNDDRVTRTYLGDGMPPVDAMVTNTSLFLVNSHFSINGARPLPPQVVQIGGVHIKPAKPLPQDLEKFMNESEHGVICFSLGSIANMSTLSEPTRKAFINSFAKLKQRVLWKWEVDEMPGKPENVKIVKWLPQGDVLAHPNTRLFIGHGGLLGVMEAVHYAVPMIGIPLFADQHQNIANLVNEEAALHLDFFQIDEDSVSQNLKAILEDSKYKKNTERLSQLFRDRPVSALDTAVYWIEYVLKHNGAHHLRTAAVGMPWYQYYLLDVLAVVISSFILVISVLMYTVRYVLRRTCWKRKEKVQ